jgi:hypothetical protein
MLIYCETYDSEHNLLGRSCVSARVWEARHLDDSGPARRQYTDRFEAKRVP